MQSCTLLGVIILLVRVYNPPPQECATPDTLSMGYADGENAHHVVQCRSCTFPARFSEQRSTKKSTL